MKQDLYVIRGTGFLGLDGTLVYMDDADEGDRYVTVTPYNHDLPASHTLKLDRRCLQQLDDKLQKFSYVIRVEKWAGDYTMQPIDEAVVSFKHSVRNVTAASISTFIEDQLSPMLRMA